MPLCRCGAELREDEALCYRCTFYERAFKSNMANFDDPNERDQAIRQAVGLRGDRKHIARGYGVRRLSDGSE